MTDPSSGDNEISNLGENRACSPEVNPLPPSRAFNIRELRNVRKLWWCRRRLKSRFRSSDDHTEMAKKNVLGCVNSQGGFTQPITNFFAHACMVCYYDHTEEETGFHDEASSRTANFALSEVSEWRSGIDFAEKDWFIDACTCATLQGRSRGCKLEMQGERRKLAKGPRIQTSQWYKLSTSLMSYHSKTAPENH